MAISPSLPADREFPSKAASVGSRRVAAPRSIVREALEGLASLKLTVLLFSLSLVLVLVGTLAQDKIGIWEVMNDYFRSFVVWVPFKVFFPQAWFPDWQGVRGGFWFVGGRALGFALGANLIAAHLVRFKVQAKGTRLTLGWLVFLAGVAVCAMIIAYGSLKDGVQDRPILDWDILWWAIVAGTVLLSVVCAGFAWKTLGGQPLLRILASLASISLMLLIGGLAFQGHRLDDSALRILWQLIQGTIGGLVLLAGSIMVFRKRAGMVVIHLGIGLLMFNELFVSVTNREQQIFVREGEETAVAIDPRFVELAIVDRSDAAVDRETLVPQSQLSDGNIVWLADLPFHVRIDRYMKNCELLPVDRATPADLQAFPKCTQGLGIAEFAIPAAPVAGAETGNRADVSAIYATVLAKDGKELATVLLPQSDHFTPGTTVHPIEVDGRTWHFELRYPREQKPYTIQLLDVVRENYVGTEVPRHYGSTFRIRRSDDGTDLQGSIKMNEPLRYGGETFYQSGFHPLPDGTEASTLQVVTNSGWMMPYVACMLVAIGMLTHFTETLGGRISKARNEAARAAADAPPLADTADKGKANPYRSPSSRAAGKSGPWWPTWVAIGAAVLLIGGAMPRHRSSFDMAGAGELPVTSGGRVMPLDTLARNLLREIRKSEGVRDAQGSSIAPTQWLLDVASRSAAASDYPLFKLQDLEVLSSLGLKKRPYYLFSYAELEPHKDEIFRAATVADGKRQRRERLERADQAFLELAGSLRDYENLGVLFGDGRDIEDGDDDVLRLLSMANRAAAVMTSTMQVPLAVPNPGDSEKPWESLIAYRARREAVAFARENASEGEAAPTVDAVSIAVVTRLLRDEKYRPVLRQVAEMIRSRSPGAADQQLVEEAQRQLFGMVASPLQELFPDGKVELVENRAAESLIGMIAAYGKADTAGFDAAVDDYRSRYAELLPAGTSISRVAAERRLNAIAPFYLATLLFLGAFPVALFGIAAPRSGLNRAAFAVLMIAVLLVTIGLIARIWISGRPPVTNLYSSALFIGWSAASILLLLERFTRIGVGNVLASVLGGSTMLIAYNLSLTGDTISVMQAVLDTQFWLATHVICITLGYGTTYVAGFLGIVYLLIGVHTRYLDATGRRIWSGFLYGMICFSLLLSFVGTVLGGLWADDSWGRFWGWDPKENGALIIVIWNALVLHARWGAMVRERGVAVLAIAGNIVTSWSWFGTNQLGFGLHSYGFTEGVLMILGVFVLSQLLLIGIGLLPLRRWFGGSDDATAALD